LRLHHYGFTSSGTTEYDYDYPNIVDDYAHNYTITNYGYTISG